MTELDWSNPATIPTTQYAKLRPSPGETPDPRYIQTNLFTLSQIGGAYDLLALEVERRHLEVLTAWRLDSGACTVLDYVREKDRHRREH